eukprot:357241-Chlamydomonas_euryale.AAC.23
MQPAAAEHRCAGHPRCRGALGQHCPGTMMPDQSAWPAPAGATECPRRPAAARPQSRSCRPIGRR